VFEFVLFAFYTLIISHHICCFSCIQLQSSSCNLQFLMFLSFPYFHTKTTQKTSHHQNIRLLTSQTSKLLQHITFMHQSTKISKTKTANFCITLFCISHTKLFSYLLLSESYKQKHHTPSEVLVFLMSCLTKSHSKIIKKLHHIKIFTKHQNHTHITISHL
jgi:hypothetical protein